MPSLSSVWKRVEKRLRGIAPCSDNKEFLEKVSYVIGERSKQIMRESRMPPLRPTMKLEFKYPGVMEVPQAIIGGNPELIPIANPHQSQWVECDYCGAPTEFIDGNCTHCGGGLSIEKMRRIASRAEMPAPSHDSLPVRFIG